MKKKIIWLVMIMIAMSLSAVETTNEKVVGVVEFETATLEVLATPLYTLLRFEEDESFILCDNSKRTMLSIFDATQKITESGATSLLFSKKLPQVSGKNQDVIFYLEVDNDEVTLHMYLIDHSNRISNKTIVTDADMLSLTNLLIEASETVDRYQENIKALNDIVDDIIVE